MKKYLPLIITLSLVAIMAVSVIVVAFIKTDYNQVALDDIYEIHVYHNGADNIYSKSADTKVFNKILDLYKEGTKEVVLSSLFQGAYSKDAKAQGITRSESFSNITTSTAKTSIAFRYSEPKTITVNGEVYKGIEGLSAIEYNYVLIVIENSTELTTITAYFNDITDVNSGTTSNYRVTFVAQLHELYEYLTTSSDIVLIGA